MWWSGLMIWRALNLAGVEELMPELAESGRAHRLLLLGSVCAGFAMV